MNKIREAFDRIHAEEELKERTREFLSRETRGYGACRRPVYRKLAPVAACFLIALIGWGGYRTFFVPTSVISIDINPSFELGINRFDRVISVKSYNDDGIMMAESLNLRFLDYSEAVERVISNENIEGYLSNNEILMITVAGADERRSGKILENVKSCTAGQTGIYCGTADMRDAKEAHALGLSCGKYRAFLEAREVKPEITVEEIRGMTVREIRDLVGDLSDREPGGRGHGRHGGHGYRQLEQERE